MTPPAQESVVGQDISPDPSAAAPSSAAITTDPTAATPATTGHNASGGESAAAAAAAAELARTKISLYETLRRFPDFPIKGVIFIDIMPIFRDPKTHVDLLRALELQSSLSFAPSFPIAAAVPWVDVIMGLDARGFLVAPGLALKLGTGFAPVRKKGKLPGPCVTASYEKEYGADYFQIQEDAIKPGQKVLIVDDIIATGGSAAAAGELVRKVGGELIGYLFILEISFLKGREKLGDVPVITLLEEA